MYDSGPPSDDLTLSPSPAQTPAQNPYADVVGEILGAPSTAPREELARSFLTASKTSPDRAAKVLEFARRRDLPVEYVDRNYDALVAEDTVRSAPYEGLLEHAPGAATFLRKPGNASVAHDELSFLVRAERAIKTFAQGYQPSEFVRRHRAAKAGYDRWESEVDRATAGVRQSFALGDLQVERSDIRSVVMERGTATPAERARLKELDTALAESNASWDDPTFLDSAVGVVTGIPGAAAGQTPLQLRTLGAGAKGYAAGAASALSLRAIGSLTAGAVAGALGGPTAAAAVTEATGSTALAFAHQGGRLGATIAIAAEVAKMEAAEAYWEYKEDMDHATAKRAGQVAGVINGVIEVGFGVEASVLKNIPVLKGLSKQAIRRVVRNHTQRAVAGRFAKTVLRTAAEEGVEEVAQTSVKNAVAGAVEMLKGTDLRTLTSDQLFDAARQAVDQAAGSFVPGFQAALAFGTATNAPTLIAEHRVAKRAERNAETFQALAEGVKDSKLMQRLPAKAREYVESLTKDGPAENVYLPVEAVTTLYQSMDLDPGEEIAKITGSREAYDQAVATGADIQIPTSVYATTLAVSDLGPRLLDELRIGSPTAMNARESKEYFKARTAEATETTESTADAEAAQIRDRIMAQLQTAGRTADVAATEAQAVEAFYRTQAERLGTTPAELYARYPLTVSGTADLMDEAGAATYMQALPGVSRAATRDTETGKVYTGSWHGASAEQIARDVFKGGDPIELVRKNPRFVEGFTLEDGTFIDRRQADDLFDRSNAEDFPELAEEAARPSQFPRLFYQSVTIRSGTETLKQYGLEPGKTYSTRQVAAALETRQREKYGMIEEDDRSPEARDKIAQWMVEEVVFEMQHPEKSGVGWYGVKFQKALDIMGERFPELRTNKDARDLMTALIAITSDGQKVVPNFAMAMDIYGNWKSSGTFSTARGHTRIESIKHHFAQIQRLHEKFGASGMREFLLQERTLSELKQMAKASGSEMKSDYQAHIRMPMAAVVFGPKLGAFYANLMGAEGYLTMDRWWSRTFNRYRGVLLELPTRQGMERVKDLFTRDFDLPRMSDDEVLSAVVPFAEDYADRGYKNGTELEKAANTIYKKTFVGLEDTPFNASDRTFMLDTVARARDILHQQGHLVSVADIQAILWYYEKRLYGELGARQSADVDYQDAARAVVEGAANADRTGRSAAQGAGTGAVSGPAGLSGPADGAVPAQAVRLGDEPFEQRAPKEGLRGQVQFRPQSGGGFSIDISLLEHANLTTAVHEFSHAYYAILGDLAQQPDAPQQIVDDYQTLLDWSGHGTHANRVAMAAERTAIAATAAREQRAPTAAERARMDELAAPEEKLARGFEAYTRAGIAPSTALRQAFHRFRAWMIQAYRQITALGVTLTPEVTRVFDRMIATDVEIAAAEAEQNVQPLFPDAALVGLSEAAAARYQALHEDAHRTAVEQLGAQMVDGVLRESTAIYQADREKMRAEVADAVNREPAQLALSVLSRATLPDGTALSPDSPLAGVKLSKAGIVEVAGTGALPGLRARFLYRVEGGMHPDAFAELPGSGFNSGAELVAALQTAEKGKDRIERLTDLRMRAEYEGGELLTSAELPDEAQKAVHNEKRAELLHRELEILASKALRDVMAMGEAVANVRGFSRRVPALAELRDWAERTVAGMRGRDVQPFVYQRAEVTAARAASKAFKAGDLALAFSEKEKQLRNHELYRAAKNAEADVEKIVSYMRTFEKTSVQARIGKAGGDYLENILDILERYSFRPRSLRAVDRAVSLRDWLDAEKATGRHPIIPPNLLNEAYRQHYRDSTLEELQGVRDTVKQIAHLATTKNRLINEKETREVEALEAELVASMGTHFDLGKEPVDLTKPMAARIKGHLADGMAQLTRMEFLFTILDGNEAQGPAWRSFFKPMADAETAELELQKKKAEAMRDIFGAYTAKERRQMFSSRFHDATARTTVMDGTFTKSMLLAIALNTGNAYNKSALLEGYGWTETQLQHLLSRLDARDWNVVQAIWDHIATYKEAAFDLEERVTGLRPEGVEATPVLGTPAGDLRGGYYPIKFNADLSLRAAENIESETIDQMFGGLSGRAMTAHGHLIARTDTGGKPLRLDLAVLAEHLNQTIHDIAFREAVIDVDHLTRRTQVKEAIEGAVGTDMYRQIRPWLKGIAGDRPREARGYIESLASHARAGATVVGLGLRISSSFVQTLGFALTVKELGPVYAARGIRDALGTPKGISKQWKFIVSKSVMMRDRMQNYDRDIRDYTKGPGLAPDSAAWFVFIGFMDLATSVPTWLGAYRKSMDGALDGVAAGDEHAAVDYADKVVRMTQSAGAAKDLAAVQRGPETHRLFTMFYSSLGMIFNQFEQAGYGYKMDRNLPRLVGALAMIWFVPAAMEQLLRGRGPDDEDDETWWGWLLGQELAYPFGTVPLVRDVATSTAWYLKTGMLSARGSPAFGALEATVLTIGAGAHAVDPDKDVSRREAQGVVDLIGYTAKLPSGQTWKTLEYLHDWWTGDIEPANPAQGIYQALVTGKPRT